MDPHWIVKWGANQWEVFDDREDAVEMATHNRGKVYDISQVPSFEWVDPRCTATFQNRRCIQNAPHYLNQYHVTYQSPWDEGSEEQVNDPRSMVYVVWRDTINGPVIEKNWVSAITAAEQAHRDRETSF